MTREKLESFVGKKVEIVLDNNDVVKGTLIKGKGWEYIDSNKELSQFHFGYAESCQATINDLEKIIG